MEAVTKSFIMRLPIVSRQDQCARGEGSKFEQWRRLVKAAICERLKSAWNEFEAFFEHGRKLARLADRGGRIPPSRVVAFDDIESLLQVLTTKRVLLLKQVRAAPGSITDLARKLRRDRSAVTRDVQALERVGVLRVTEKSLPGHGRQKWIAPIARDIRLTAQL